MKVPMNVPNILTIFRIFLIPVYIVAFCTCGEVKNAAGWIFIIASATDVIDGFIARKFNMMTKAGQLLDPLADKLMQLTVVISLLIAEIIPLWFVIILAAKEILMIMGGIFLYSKKTFVKSNVFGKVNTVILFLAMIAVLFAHTSEVVTDIVLSISAISNFVAIGSYVYIYALKHEQYKDYLDKNYSGGESLE